MVQNSYLFVFSKPFEKTDISKGELVSLIELQKKDVVIRVNLIEEYEDKFGKLNFFKKTSDLCDKNITYILFLSQSAIVICNFEINIKEIIRRSGYIHSCGKFLFLSKWEDLSVENLRDNIVDFCKTENAWHSTVFYKYSDNKIQNKLEPLIIDDTRYHIKNQSFNIAVGKLESELKQKQQELRLKYKQEHIFIFLEKVKVNENSILSNLYEDRNIVDYSICYLSQYKKDNPIHEMDDFKELKPYWAGIFTTPHRLMNAMLNIAKVDEKSIVVDPFCHTGTLAIEASQIGCKVIVSDICGTNGAKDNYDFLCKGAKNFKSLVNKIEKHLEDDSLTMNFKNIISDNIKLNEQGLPETKGDIIDLIPVLSERLYFYILRRYNMEIHRGAELGTDNYKDYVKGYIEKFSNGKLLPSYRLFTNQFVCFEEEHKRIGIPLVSINTSNENFFTDSFYKSNRIGYINKSKRKKPKFMKNDICDDDNYNISESSVDAVITDPPYGYGEDLSIKQVEKIYTSLINKAIKWLKPKGFLIFCALDKVKTGRKENLLFTENILDIVSVVSKKNQVDFVLNDILLTSNHLKNVYYWKSKYALNRSIICLQILKNN